jgi:hypothetical protein
MSSSDGRIKTEAQRHRARLTRTEARYEEERNVLRERHDVLMAQARAEFEARLTALTEANRISREALSVAENRELQEVEADRNARLEEFVKEQLALMRSRCYDAGVERGEEYEWLHDRTFDATYRDHGPAEGRRRVRYRIKALLELSDESEELLLTYYRRYLNFFFPIKGDAEWNPVVSHSDGHVTIIHQWKIV